MRGEDVIICSFCKINFLISHEGKISTSIYSDDESNKDNLFRNNKIFSTRITALRKITFISLKLRFQELRKNTLTVYP